MPRLLRLSLRVRWGAMVVPVLATGLLLGAGAKGSAGEGTVAVQTMGSSSAPVDTVRRAREGAPVPHFSVARLRDSTRTYEPSTFEGRYVLLNLWATWCAPCIEKLPALQKARDRYSPDRLAILNVSFDRSRSAAADFVEARTMPGAHAYVGVSALGGRFGTKFARIPGEGRSMRGLPNLTLVGPDGEVVAILPATAESGVLEMLEEKLS